MKIHTLAVALLACAVSAQTQNIVYHDDPNPTTGGANAFPFGSQGVRTQQLVPQSVIGGTPGFIQDIFVNPQVANVNPPAVSQVYYGDIEIRMGVTQLTTLTNDWLTNMPSPTTVYRGPLLVRFERDQWTPLGLPNPYLWLPLSPLDNLVVDIILWQVTDTGAVTPDVNGYFMNMRRSVTGTISRAYRRGWTAGQLTTAAGVDGSGVKLGFLFNDGNFVAHNGSCSGSSTQVPVIAATANTWPQFNVPFDVHLQSGPANTFANLMLGLQTGSYGPYTLPLDLAPFGAGGCLLWHSPDALLPFQLTDGAGATTTTLVFPSLPGLSQLRVYASWICFDPAANSLGLVPSGFATLIL